MLARSVGRSERGTVLVYSIEVFARGSTLISTDSWMQSTGVISPTEPGESRA